MDLNDSKFYNVSDRFGGIRIPDQGDEYRYDIEFFMSNFCDYEEGRAEPIVKDRMRANIAFWKVIGAMRR